MVKLAIKIAPHIHGHVHIQTNPYFSYSTEKTIVNALSMALRTVVVVAETAELTDG